LACDIRIAIAVQRDASAIIVVGASKEGGVGQNRINHQGLTLVVFAHFESDLMSAATHVMAGDGLPRSVRLLIYRRFAHPDLGVPSSQDQVSITVDPDCTGAFKSHSNSVGVGVRSDFKIVFEVPLIAVVNKIHPGIQISILNPAIGGYV
jgi:hypothetical protein